MNEERIQEIKDNLRQIMEQITSIGESPPPEIQQLLMQVIEKAQGQIQQLRQEDQQVQTQAIEAPIPESAKLLWILAGGQPEAFAQYIGTYPDASLNAIHRNPAELQRIIAELSQQMPQGVGQEKDGIPKADLNSSNIYGFKYDPRTGKLLVRFQEGNVYAYEGVPQQIYKIFASGAIPAKTKGKNRFGQWWRGKTPSAGASFHALIKQGGYPYQKLS